MQCCCTSLIRDKRVERGELWERISTHLSRKGAEEMSGNLQQKKLLKHSETHGFAITVFARFSLYFILGCEHERIDLNQAEAPPGESTFGRNDLSILDSTFIIIQLFKKIYTDTGEIFRPRYVNVFIAHQLSEDSARFK